MGGIINVKSKVGKGSIFTFDLNLKINKNYKKKKRTSLKKIPNKSKMNILLAENDLSNIIYIQTVLEKLGYKVDLAHNGKEAVKKFKQGNYSLVIMDIKMPKMDGLEATRNIRKLEKRKHHTPIIALTAYYCTNCICNG